MRGHHNLKSAHSQVKEMMDNIRRAFREEVANLTWIDDETRPKVYEKVYSPAKT